MAEFSDEGYQEEEKSDPFFNEELRTHSAEEYQALKRENVSLRRRRDQLEEAQNAVHEELESAGEVLAERSMLIKTLQKLIQEHRELLEEIVSILGNDGLLKEIVEGANNQCNADDDENESEPL